MSIATTDATIAPDISPESGSCRWLALAIIALLLIRASRADVATSGSSHVAM